MATATAAYTVTGSAVVFGALETWRCHACRRIICRMEYRGYTMEHKCRCNSWNRLPDDAAYVRVEQQR